jgi:predicted DNA-binding transcriptional regulator YafY
MPSNKSAFYRYLLIDKRIANKYQPYPNLEEIKSYIEEKTGQNISTRQLEYDLAEMKNSEVLAFYAPIEFDKTNKGYKYSDSKYSIGQFVKLNQDDLDSLEMAFEILDTYKGIDVFKNFKVAIDKMNNEFSVTKNHSALEVENILQPQINSSSEGLQWLNILVGLIKEKSSIKILYGKFSGEKKYYVLSPIILKEFDSRWYLVARDAKDKTIKVFGLERILEIEKNEFNYELGDFNSKVFFKNVYGITINTNAKVEEVVLEFESYAANFIKTKPIHSSQKILNETQNGVIFQLDVYPSVELKNLILSWGRSCRVLSPADFRNEIKNELQAALNSYN